MKFPSGFGFKTRLGKGAIRSFLVNKNLDEIKIKTIIETTAKIIFNYYLEGVLRRFLYLINTSCDS